MCCRRHIARYDAECTQRDELAQFAANILQIGYVRSSQFATMDLSRTVERVFDCEVRPCCELNL